MNNTTNVDRALPPDLSPSLTEVNHYPSITPSSSPTSSSAVSTVSDPAAVPFHSVPRSLSPVSTSHDSNLPIDPFWYQTLSLESGDLHATITLYHVSAVAWGAHVILSCASLGFFALISHWAPVWWIKLFGQRLTPSDDPTLSHTLSTDDSDQNDVATLTHFSLPTPWVPPNGKVWAAITNSWNQSTLAPITAVNFHGKADSVFSGPFDPEYLGSTIIPWLVSFDYRSLRLIWNPFLGIFTTTSQWKDLRWFSTNTLAFTSLIPDQFQCFWSLDQRTIDERREVFGDNSVLVPEPSTLQLIIHEVLHPFTVFQVFSIILWSINTYYWYAMAVAFITIVSAISTLRQTKHNIRRLRELGKHEYTVSALRMGEYITIPSQALVPGDLIRIDALQTPEVPCDILIVAGDAVADESVLTGESIPVGKCSASPSLLSPLDLTEPTLPEGAARSVLFAGTRLIRARGPAPGGTAMGLVVRSGFNTAKGSLIRAMMHPRPHASEMVQDAFRFLGVLAIFGAVGFFYTLALYISQGHSAKVIIIRSLDVLTLVIPPALPATLSAGISFALNRLRPKSIFCTSPNHITMAGQVRVAVFDKTGTITEDGLAVVGVHPSQSCDLICDVNTLIKVDNRMVMGMATCHDVKHLHYHHNPDFRDIDENTTKKSEMIGDPLEVKMVEWTGADVHDCVNAGVEVVLPDCGTRLSIIRAFEFVSALRRMAVVVKSNFDGIIRVFAKGAPEAMEAICLPRSIPVNYKAMVDDYAQRGLRVLALASRDLTPVEINQLSNRSRTDIEYDLEFLGFVVFENPVKPGSRPAIETLQSASIRCIMCTGDNLVTAVSVARKVRIIHPVERVYVPMVVPAKGVVAWVAHDNPSDVFTGGLEQLQSGTSLAITGEAFDGLVHMGWQSDLDMILARGAVFARMAPDHKRILVEMLREKNNGEGIAFCGDGANDCAALKAADVGLSLSDAEASIAAPFTSAERDIGCVVTLIQEGRAALVTAHSCFKFMSCYSMCQFTSVCILYGIGSNLGDFQFLYIDIILVLPLALAMARSEASKALSPIAPASRLVSKPILFTVISTMMLQVGMQLLTFYVTQAQPWYKPPDVDPETQLVSCYEGTSLFILSCFMYMAMAVCFAAGEPYRTSVLKNSMFVTVLVAVIFSTIMLANVRDPGIMWFFDLMEVYNGWQWNVIALASLYAGVVLVIERVASTLLTRPSSTLL